MRRIVVTNWVEPEALEPIQAAGAFVVANEDRQPWSRERLAAELADAEVMIGFMPDMVDAQILAAAPKLKLIACALKGYDNFDIRACRERGVKLTIVQDLLTIPGAELAVGSMIALARHVLAGDALVRSGQHQGWRPQLYGTGLAGSSVGFVGFGAIARAIAERLQPFGCANLIAYDRAPVEAKSPVEFTTLEAVLGQSDYVVLGLSLNAFTRHILDRDRISLLRSTAFLINPARGSLVDEEALADALEEGRLAGYASDVFALEDWAFVDGPSEISPRLLRLRDRTLFTPHLGSAVESVRRQIADSAIASAVAFLRGKPLDGEVV